MKNTLNKVRKELESARKHVDYWQRVIDSGQWYIGETTRWHYEQLTGAKSRVNKLMERL